MVTDKPSIDAIFLAAVDLQPEQRAAYLNVACGQDRELRTRVERLLAAQSHVASFLESPAQELGATIERPIAEQPGTIIGPYKLRELLAEGGMGSVYVAEQEHPVRRKVALKVIKPGMDSRQVLSRFEAERQALALMEHPHIAKVLDAGTTDTGRPYFVMELVKGIPITEFCDQRRIELRERLELFVEVCRAIQHAHQKGIIHRDIKPSNILVTLHDDLAVPMVIDFGIAKATGPQLTEQTIYTAFNQLIGSPLYMSPEQAQLNALDVDTRSDVYSLGVLLYELLTGSTPFDSNTLREAGFDEMRRMIREVDPPRPSVRISTLDAQAASTVFESRGVDDRRLHRVLRGDIDWIVMKALEKDRNRRYESASSLAADVQRHLDGEPIEAKQPRFFAGLRKWCRRHRTATTTSVVAAVLLLMFATGMTADRRRQVRDATQSVETSLQASTAALAADDVQLVAQRLAEAQTRIDAARLADPAILRQVTALKSETERYAKFVPLLEKARMSRSYEENDARAQDALALYGVMDNSRWLDLLRATGLPETHIKTVTEGVYELLLLEADRLIRWQDYWPKATRFARLKSQSREAAEILEKAVAFHAPSRGYYWLLANCSLHLGDKDKEERLRITALETPPHDAAELFYINRDRVWGTVSHYLGYPDYTFEQSYQDHREMLRLNPTYYNAMFFIADYHFDNGRYEAALVGWYACVAMRPDDYTSILERGRTHSRLGHFEEAKADYETALTARPKHPFVLYKLAIGLATDPADEMRDGKRAVELARKSCKLTNFRDPRFLDTLASAYAESDDFESAVKWSEKAVELSDNYLRDQYSEHLESFRQGKPWRDK